MRWMMACLLALGLCACSQQEMMDKFASPQEQATARAYLENLRKREFDPIEKAADASIRTADLRQSLEQMARLIPAGEPQAVKLVGAHTNTQHTEGTKTVNLTFEYRFGEQWLLSNVATMEKNGAKTIIGISVVPQKQSLEERNHFTLAGKGPVHYLILLAALAAVALTLYALVLCIRTPLPRRKWLWVVFIGVGFGSVGINWATGLVFFAPLAVQLLSAAATAPMFGPWTVAVSLPVGAIVFLLRRKALMAPATPAPG